MPTPDDETSPAAVSKGVVLRDRATAAGLSVAALARLAHQSRTTVYAVFEDRASEDKVADVERAIEFAETNPGDVEEQPGAVQFGSDLMEFEVNVDAVGVRVVVRGSVENAELLEAQAAKLIRDMRRDPAAD